MVTKIESIDAGQWEQAWQTRQCLACGEKTRRQLASLHNRDSYHCDACGLIVWYEHDLTAAGRAVANGYGWAGAPFSDGRYPKLREKERYGCYYAEPVRNVNVAEPIRSFINQISTPRKPVESIACIGNGLYVRTGSRKIRRRR